MRRPRKRGGHALRLIVDTSVLFAVADRSDRRHEPCLDLLATFAGVLTVPTLVFGETGYMIESILGPAHEAAFLRSIVEDNFEVQHPDARDFMRMIELVVTYADWPLGTVDASVVATAERLGATSVATLDHRHFAAIKPRHCDAFELLP